MAKVLRPVGKPNTGPSFVSAARPRGSYLAVAGLGAALLFTFRGSFFRSASEDGTELRAEDSRGIIAEQPTFAPMSFGPRSHGPHPLDRFAFELFSQLSADDGHDVFISPASVAIALAMVAGATTKGEARPLVFALRQARHARR